MNPALAERRLELGALAAQRERRNRPRVLLLAAFVLLAASLLFLVLSWNSSREARRFAVGQQRLAEQALAAGAELKRLKDAQAAMGGTIAAPAATQVRSRIQQAGAAAGLRDAAGLVPRTDRRSFAEQRVVQEQLRYEITDPSLAALMDWMRRATAEVPGLEVYRVRLEPTTDAWRLQVTFARWEKLGS
jgi:hypothetical protein